MGTANYGATFAVAGISAGVGASVTAEGEMKQSPSCEMGYAGPISTDTDRVITTTSTDPDLEANDVVAIFWPGGMAIDKIQSVTGGNDQTIKLSSGGASAEGDALPANATECIIAVCAEVALLIPASQLEAVAVNATTRASISFRESDDTLITTQEHTASVPYGYISGLSFTDPVGATACELLWVATANVTADETVDIGILYDSV